MFVPALPYLATVGEALEIVTVPMEIAKGQVEIAA